MKIRNISTGEVTVVRDDPPQGWVIPDGWVEDESAQIQPQPDPVPAEVPMWALKEVCLIRGHGPEIESALNSLPDPPRTIARNRWENKDTISRGSSIISAMQSLLGWSSEYVDELFRSANSL